MNITTHVIITRLQVCENNCIRRIAVTSGPDKDIFDEHNFDTDNLRWLNSNGHQHHRGKNMLKEKGKQKRWNTDSRSIQVKKMVSASPPNAWNNMEAFDVRPD